MGKITGMPQRVYEESKSNTTNATEQKGPRTPIRIEANPNNVNPVHAYWSGPAQHPAVRELSMPRPPTPRPNDSSPPRSIQPQGFASAQQHQSIQPQPQGLASAQQQQSIQPQTLALPSQTHPRPQMPKFSPPNNVDRVPVGKGNKP